MPGSAGPNLGLLWGWEPGEPGWGVDGFNPAFALLDAVVQLAVLSAPLAAPPASPAPGDRHIVAAGATGAWAGRDDAVAVFRGGAWAFIPPGAGWVARVLSPPGLLAFDGSAWVAAVPPDAVARADAAAALGAAQEALAEAGGVAADASAALSAAQAAQSAAAALDGRVDALEAAPAVSVPFEASVAVNGKPAAAEVLVRHKMAGPVSFAAALAGWQFTAGAAATAERAFSARKNNAEFGTLTVAAGSAAASLAGAATAFAAGDVLTVLAPVSPDATLADIGITIRGTRG